MVYAWPRADWRRLVLASAIAGVTMGAGKAEAQIETSTGRILRFRLPARRSNVRSVVASLWKPGRIPLANAREHAERDRDQDQELLPAHLRQRDGFKPRWQLSVARPLLT